MTIIIAGPSGEPLEFETEAEVEAYRRSQREAEPALLRRLRQRQTDIDNLYERAGRGLTQRAGRTTALEDIRSRLHRLRFAIWDDIKAAESDLEQTSKAPAKE